MRLLVILVFYIVLARAIDFIDVLPVLRSQSETAFFDGYDQYIIQLCQPPGTPVVVTVSNLGFRDKKVVFAFGGKTPYPTMDRYEKGWTTFNNNPYVPLPNFTAIYDGTPLYISVIASGVTKQADYNMVVTPLKKDNVIPNSDTKTTPSIPAHVVYETQKLNPKTKPQNVTKYLFPTYQSVVTGVIGFGDEKYYRFPICKGSIPPRHYVFFSIMVVGDYNSCGFTQYLSDTPDIDPLHPLPDCVDREQNTPSYIECNKDRKGTPWSDAYAPDFIYALLIGWGGDGLSVLNPYKLNSRLYYQENSGKGRFSV